MKIDRQLFRTGIPIIDNQHEAYIDLLDDLFAAGQEAVVDRTKVENAIKKAFAYGIEHFDAEEMLMQSLNYPGLQTHRKKHNEFREEVERIAFSSQFRSDDDLLKEVNTWMLVWFCEQTQVYDKALVEFMKSRVPSLK
jgi:hemerythrin